MAATKNKNPLGPGLLRFLRELDENNTKAWWGQNKARYEEDVREPALELIRVLAPTIEKLSPYLVASDSKVGGSMMRPFRDVRFSRDKRPYKTNLGIQFRHESAKDVHAPGYYLHIDPKEVFLGAGMWHPDGPSLRGVRSLIDTDPATWKRISRGKAFRAAWDFEGESLKRAPKGYDPEHPLIEDLRRKDHIAVVRLKRVDVTRADLPQFLAKQFKLAKPYMALLTKAVGLPF